MTRRLRLPVLALLALAASAAPAGAAACPTLKAPQCFSVTVPLDYSGVQPGTIQLPVVRYLATSPPARGTLVVLVGGPGQAALPFVEDFRGLFDDLAAGYDIVVFDERGTGSAGALSCASFDSPTANGDPAACAAQLGPGRSLYTTREAVADLDAVRARLNVARIAIFGVSYGTRVARAYAASHPADVDLLVLDSAVPLNGPDPMLRSTIAALPRVLTAVCAKRACRGVTNSPYADVVALAHKLERSPLAGYAVDPRGRRHRTRIPASTLLSALTVSAFDPVLRAELPAAIRAARSGDAAPMLRLLIGNGAEIEEPPESSSRALFAATSCEEDIFPWARTATPAAREAAARAGLSAAAAQLAPFSPNSVYSSSFFSLCASWPVAPAPPAIPNGPIAGVRTLILSGQQDLRTPLEDARGLAASIAGAQVVQVANAGHSVLGTAPDACPIDDVVRFFEGGAPVTDCLGSRPPVPISPLPPRSLSLTARAGGVAGTRGRVARAVELTIEDAIEQGIAGERADLSHTPSLRRGYYVGRGKVIDLHRAVYVPGVTVSGRLRQNRITLRITGTLRVLAPGGLNGTLELAHHRLTGKLGGRRVHTRTNAEVADAAGGDRLDRLAAELARVRAKPWLRLR